MKKKVLIATRLAPIARDVLESHGSYEVVEDGTKDLDELIREYPDTAVLVVRSEKVTPEVIDALPELKIVVRSGSGVNTIDTRYARSKGIDVMNTPAANANAVAEEVIALILADGRHIIEGDRTARAGKWEKHRLVGRELAGKTIGIVGLGYVGQFLARRLSGFEVTLLGIDPLITPSRAEELGVELVDIETLFHESDYVTLHIPENDDTRGLVNESLFGVMKHGATLINCARAGIIDEDALRRIKPERGLRFLNDVYHTDEAGPKSVADVADLMMPHLGASTVESGENAARRAAEQLIAFHEQGNTAYIVNREIPQGLDEAYCGLVNVLARLCRGLVGKDASPTAVATSFYGTLHEYADWLLVPLVTGLWDEVSPPNDYHAARAMLKDRGIDYASRDVDAHKGYENSITVDLTCRIKSGDVRNVSVRGTVTEGRIMLSRVNDFDRLYLDPFGHTVFFIYDDRPGVLGQIGVALAGSGINIEDVRNPHNDRTGLSLATMKINQPPSSHLVAEIAEQIKARSAFQVSL